MYSFLFFCISIFIIQSTIGFQCLAENLAPIEIQSERIKITDESASDLHKTILQKSNTDREIGETISKLPGVTSRNVAGVGSLTTIILPGSLNAGSSSISIDGIPVPDPSGLGINVSLFPSALIQAVEEESIFGSHAKDAHINLVTLHSLKSNSSASLRYGSAKTLNFGLGINKKIHKTDILIGGIWNSTRGDFHYKNPDTKQNSIRKNNDSAQGGLLTRIKTETSESGSFEMMNLVSRIDRTNPGALTFPSRDHERDSFNVVGLKFDDKKLFSENTGFSSVVSGNLSRVQNWISDLERTDAHTFGGFANAGIEHQKCENQYCEEKYFLSIDNNFEKLNDGNGSFQRNIVGMNPGFQTKRGDFRLLPKARVENSVNYGNLADGFLTTEWNPEPLFSGFSASLSYGYHHTLPPIIAQQGYAAGSYLVLPNSKLVVERDATTEASIIFDKEWFKISNTSFYHLILNRAVYSNLSFTTARYENVPRASIIGNAVDFQIKPVQDFIFRNTLSIERAWDRLSGREFPYKPRFTSYTSISYDLTKFSTFVVEETFTSKRLINLTDSQSISPNFQTVLKLNWNAFKNGQVFVRVKNLLDSAGYATAGYPIEGRSYDLGLQINEI